MFKKIFLVSLLGIVLAGSAHALTLREILQKPLPNVIDFINKVIALAQWLWSKIVYCGNIVLDWTLDNIIAYIWKVILWFWNLTKTAFLNGWQMLENIIKALLGQSGIDWANIKWPWE
ncbi:MAG: hypothetical protein AB1721_02930 [Patescibacteria group bacterium]